MNPPKNIQLSAARKMVVKCVRIVITNARYVRVGEVLEIERVRFVIQTNECASKYHTKSTFHVVLCLLKKYRDVFQENNYALLV